MKQKKSVWLNRCFVLAFFVLTFFCWCPRFYGSYGATERLWGIPSWAVWAFACGAVLFVLEWVYLFLTGNALSDKELPDIESDLAKVDVDASPAVKEDN